MVWKPSDIGKASHPRATPVTFRRTRLSSPIAGLGSLYARRHRLTAGRPAGHGEPKSAWAPPAATNRPSTPHPATPVACTCAASDRWTQRARGGPEEGSVGEKGVRKDRTGR